MPQVIMGPRATELRQLENSYNVRDFQLLNEPTKQIQRDRVLAHMQQHNSALRPRLFSLPASWWSFEDQFLRAFPNADIVAVEKNYEIYRNGITFMPGERKHRVHEGLRTGTLLGHWSSRAKILWCEASTLIMTGRSELQHEDKKTKTKRRKDFNRCYKRWTCVWWDFTSPICRETIDCLTGTERWLSFDVPVCPVSITLLPAREDRDTGRLMKNLVPEDVEFNLRRVLFLERWLNRCNQHRQVEVIDYFPYESAGGCPMLLVNTLFTLRSSGKELT